MSDGIDRLLAPYHDAAAVIPSDTTDLPKVARGLHIGGAGDVKLTLWSGATVTLAGIPAGTERRVVARRVWATGTTATNIVALS
jgi:hypothetical protein